MGVSAPSSLASQTYFRERMRAKKGEGEEGKNTSGHYCQDFVSTWYVRNVISWPITYVESRLVNETEAQCLDKCFEYSAVLPRTDCLERIVVCYPPGV